MIQALEGGCLCGRVRYRANGATIHVNHCHCEMCRRGSGAPVVTWATFKTSDVAFVKEPPTFYRSSAKAVRGFCSTCGSALTWQGDASPEEIDITAGSLDRPDAVQPADHIWTASQIAWLHMADDLPRYPRQRSEGTTKPT
ncbi:MAG: GFA family protein [Proteobacteria bacterium]|nr:GFA family protein [Pseudomonadota bacterium]